MRLSTVTVRLGEPIDGVREVREFYVVNGFQFKDGKLQDNLIHSNNHNWRTDPGFVDYENIDFTIRKDAEILDKIPGLEKIPFREIGLRSKPPPRGARIDTSNPY
jgi:hypothetical protein